MTCCFRWSLSLLMSMVLVTSRGLFNYRFPSSPLTQNVSVVPLRYSSRLFLGLQHTAPPLSHPVLLWRSDPVHSCFSRCTACAVLTGDHLQLRPKAEVYRLTKESRKGFDLDVSMFERVRVKQIWRTCGGRERISVALKAPLCPQGKRRGLPRQFYRGLFTAS